MSLSQVGKSSDKEKGKNPGPNGKRRAFVFKQKPDCPAIPEEKRAQRAWLDIEQKESSCHGGHSCEHCGTFIPRSQEICPNCRIKCCCNVM